MITRLPGKTRPRWLDDALNEMCEAGASVYISNCIDPTTSCYLITSYTVTCSFDQAAIKEIVERYGFKRTCRYYDSVTVDTYEKHYQEDGPDFLTKCALIRVATHFAFCPNDVIMFHARRSSR